MSDYDYCDDSGDQCLYLDFDGGYCEREVTTLDSTTTDGITRYHRCEYCLYYKSKWTQKDRDELNEISPGVGDE